MEAAKWTIIMPLRIHLSACVGQPNFIMQLQGNCEPFLLHYLKQWCFNSFPNLKYIRGLQDDIEMIKLLLERDPKRHMYETSNPHHMINHENSFGLRPLYIACLHGHLNVLNSYNISLVLGCKNSLTVWSRPENAIGHQYWHKGTRIGLIAGGTLVTSPDFGFPSLLS